MKNISATAPTGSYAPPPAIATGEGICAFVVAILAQLAEKI